MSPSLSSDSGRSFASTQWSVVLRAGHPDQPATADALATLCERYWSPVYVYIRRHNRDEHAARDLTQSFFVHMLEHNAIAKASPERGRFRSFLLTAVKNFLVNAHLQDQAQKRGGGHTILSLDWDTGETRWNLLEPSHSATAERLFEREWALQLLQGVMDQLRSEFADQGKSEQFDVLRQALAGQSDRLPYELLGQQLNLSTEAARQAAHRLRKRYRELLRTHVAATLDDGEDVEAEIGRLIEILGQAV
jgi:RNA polymerase sigma-70 factor (ECF subfamily)